MEIMFLLQSDDTSLNLVYANFFCKKAQRKHQVDIKLYVTKMQIFCTPNFKNLIIWSFPDSFFIFVFAIQLLKQLIVNFQPSMPLFCLEK